jgi:hypothetical protein
VCTSHELIALLLWGVLFLSPVLMVGGLSTERASLLFASAALSFVFGIVSIFSTGIFILALTLVQLVFAIVLRRNTA